jgi:hypothetical protein
VTTPDGPGEQRPAQPLLRLEQPLGRQGLAPPVELREQVALAGHAHVGDQERERRR